MTELAPVALLLTKVAVPEALAASSAMYKIPVDAVPTEIGAVAACRSAAPGDPEIAAQVISGLLRDTPVVLMVQRDGQLTATQWQDGSEEKEIPAALMLSGAPPQIERLLLGQVTPGEIEGTVSSVGMGRWKAMRILAAIARQNKKRQHAGEASESSREAD